MAARVERWNAHVKDVAGVHIGENVRTLMRNRGGESSVGNLVTDAMRAASGVDVALQNSGGLRADLPAGEITRGSIYEIMPFDNTLVTLELTGAELVTVLEEGLKYGRVTQASGLRYQFDPDRPEMQRVVEVTLARGEPLDRTKTYRIAVNNFMATGGDNYVTLSRGRNVVDTGLVIRGALEEHVTKLTRGGTPLDVKDDGRIRRSGSRESPSGSR
jgi:2',3'-cyclic-nucleotide 2'-phosphodiesterase (5'-nucleotidase family)